MKIRKEVTINTSVDNAWDLMGRQFGDVHKWSSNFKASQPSGAPKFNNLAYSGRITTTERGETVQVLDKFDDSSHLLEYHITIGAPEMAEKTYAIWSIEPVDETSTKATFEFGMELKAVVNDDMAKKVEMQLSKSADEMAEEFKYYLEHNETHSRNGNK